ncbi:MAG: VOC family protein [Flavobacteriaceae bacterium]|nr:VOC family protein [Flavobacteriaceae bacterium]
MTIKKIYACWVYVSDLEISKAFFQKLGFDLKFQQEDWIEFNLGATSFAILKRPAEKGKFIPQKTRIMFEVDDMESLYEELKRKGIHFIGSIRNENYGKLLTFEDPDGNWFELFEGKV